MIGPELVSVDEGAPIETDGGVLSTLKVVLGPAPVSKFPIGSEEVPAAMVMPSVPSPVILEIVTVGLLVVPLETLTDPFADPVLLRVILPEVRFTEEDPVYVILNVTGPAWVSVTEGAPIETEGGVLSTLNVVLGPSPVSVFPALSEEADEILIPNVPSPVILEIVTVGLLVVPLETLTDPSADPVLLSVILPEVRLTISAPEYVMLKVTGPVLVSVREGVPMLAVGGILSTLKVVPGPSPESVFPALSDDVPAAMVIPSVPFPVMLEIVTVGLLVVPLETLTEPLAVPDVLRVISPEVRLTLSAPE